jgi:nucleoside-diphosphate-sugar epimerase
MTERVLVTGGSGFIGSHLVDGIASRGYALMNLDTKPPSAPGHEKHWVPCDVKDGRALAAAFKDFRPSRIIHLAAKANLNGTTVKDFPDNTLGTGNVVQCVNDTDSVKLFVNTSTQYVVKPGVYPVDGDYLEPYTAYGESKAVAERIVRDNCKRSWSMIRPTNIWGPGHPFFPYELWRYFELRYYVHPGFKPIRKYYGYVGNAVEQILRIALSENPTDVADKVWYITDSAIDNADWMNGFSVGLSGKTVRRVPLPLWRTMALVGDILRSVGLRFPVNGERLFRLTVNESLPEEMIVKLSSQESTSLQDGIAKSIEYYRATQGQHQHMVVE